MDQAEKSSRWVASLICNFIRFESGFTMTENCGGFSEKEGGVANCFI